AANRAGRSVVRRLKQASLSESRPIRGSPDAFGLVFQLRDCAPRLLAGDSKDLAVACPAIFSGLVTLSMTVACGRMLLGRARPSSRPGLRGSINYMGTP